MKENQNPTICKCIIFDLDGTLIDSSFIKTEIFGDIFQEFGMDAKNKAITHHKKHEGLPRSSLFTYPNSS